MTGRTRSSMKSRSINPTSSTKKRSVSQRSPKIDRKTIQKQDNDNKENLSSNIKTPPREKSEKSSLSPATSGVTPYWKIALERGLSPPNTRSAIKKRRESSLPTCGISGSGIQLTFSPPDHAKNAKREREELERRERERQIRVNLARDNGQLMIFSPPHKKNRRQSNKKYQEHDVKNSFCLNLSPGENSLCLKNVESVVDGKSSIKESRNFVTEIEIFSSTSSQVCSLDPPIGTLSQKNENSTNSASKSSGEKTESGIGDDHGDTFSNCFPEVSERLTDIQKALDTMQNENHRVEVIKEMMKQSDTLLSKNGQLEREKGELQKIIELKCEEAKNSSEKYSTEFSNLKKKHQAIEVQMGKAKEELDRQNSQMWEENRSLQLSNKLLVREKQELLERTVINSQEMEETTKNITKDYANLQIQYRVMEENLENMKIEMEFKNSGLVEQCNGLELKNRELEKQKKDLQKIIESKIQEREESVTDLNENKNLKSKCQDMEIKIESLQKKLSEKESQLNTAEQELQLSQVSLKKSTDNLLQVKESNESLVKEIDHLTSRIEQLTCGMNSTQKKLALEKDRSQDVKNRLDSEMYARQIERDQQRKYVSKLERELQCTSKLAQTAEQRELSLNNRIRILDDVRRILHNKVMQLTGNIRVYVRIRGMIPCELKKQNDLAEMPFSFPSICDNRGSNNSDDLTKHFIEAKEPHRYRGGLKERRKKWRFAFDNVFSPSNGQDDVWNVTEPLVQSTIDGYNVCLFAYGQTGSGKTYTMLGDKTNPGIVSRAVEKLFAGKTDTETSTKSTKVTISVELVEIYNEQVRDLLTRKTNTGYNEVQMRPNSNETANNILVETSSLQDVFTILELARTRRCVKATKSNSESSRSHLIFTIHYEASNKDGIQSRGKLHICDLAGSERLSKSECTGSLLKETQHINKSLSALSNVIENLQSKNRHIPYRDSKLTYLLRNSLGGDSKTLAIVCCNPLADHFNESLCSLRFASKANRVELKAAGNFSC